MCLIVKKGTKKIVLKKDKVVWKVVRMIMTSNLDEKVRAEYNYYTYYKGKTCKTRICKEKKYWKMCACDGVELRYLMRTIAEASLDIRDMILEGKVDAYGSGFHFFETKTRARQSYNECGRSDEALVRFVIPAGSTIILSGNGVGISNRIIYSPK